MFRTIATLLLAATLTHCLATPPQALDLSGNWTGTWYDFRPGHKGPLRATLALCRDG